MMSQMKYDVFKVVDGQRIHKGNYSDFGKAIKKAQKVLNETTKVHVVVEGYDDYNNVIQGIFYYEDENMSKFDAEGKINEYL